MEVLGITGDLICFVAEAALVATYGGGDASVHPGTLLYLLNRVSLIADLPVVELAGKKAAVASELVLTYITLS